MNSTASPARAFRRLPLLAVAALQAYSQQFEVASIKASKAGAVVQDMQISFPPGRFEAVNITLNEMLAAMSGFSGKVQGGPKWTESERYDIHAKADGDIPPGQRNQMVMGLLQDRFKLAVHRETKEAPGLALAIGKNPPQLDSAKDGEKFPIRSGDKKQVVFQSVSMFEFVNYLGQIWQTTVIDHTGMKGKFDFSLDPYSFATVNSAGSPLGRESFADLLRTAVERLGFLVETQKVPLNITVIDRVERPSEN